MGLLEIATTALVGAEQRTAIAARNIANVRTPGYKREVAFSTLSTTTSPDGVSGPGLPRTGSAFWSAEGVLTETGSPLDLAIRGGGHMLLRDGDRYFLSRGGSFRRDVDGAVIDGSGRVVQQAGGGDLVLEGDDPEILGDGTVLVAKAPVATLGLYAPDEALLAEARGGLTAEQVSGLTESGAAGVRQGMLERSNVVLSDEMIGLMRSQRLAEAGAQLVRAYDQLMGQAVATLGRKSA